jgi:type II secretory pathway pseudopilin PulG
MTRLTEVGGYSLLELMMATTIGVVLTGTAVPEYLTGLDDLRARGAAQHVSGRLQRARMEAVRRSAMVGVQFTEAADGHYSYTVYQDGNRNGVLTRDIQSGIDRPIAPVERLLDQFSGVEFGAMPGLPPVDAGGTPPGADPVRLGSGSIASFSALGTATSGTVFIRGRRGSQYAVRIYGETGRTRLLKFEPRTGTWKQL